ncbi:hypothetical protein DFJ74DRAFT_752018, partial [Hyaloraphidium curvatum]
LVPRSGAPEQLVKVVVDVHPPRRGPRHPPAERDVDPADHDHGIVDRQHRAFPRSEVGMRVQLLQHHRRRPARDQSLEEVQRRGLPGRSDEGRGEESELVHDAARFGHQIADFEVVRGDLGEEGRQRGEQLAEMGIGGAVEAESREQRIVLLGEFAKAAGGVAALFFGLLARFLGPGRDARREAQIEPEPARALHGKALQREPGLVVRAVLRPVDAPALGDARVLGAQQLGHLARVDRPRKLLGRRRKQRIRLVHVPVRRVRREGGGEAVQEQRGDKWDGLDGRGGRGHGRGGDDALEPEVGGALRRSLHGFDGGEGWCVCV